MGRQSRNGNLERYRRRFPSVRDRGRRCALDGFCFRNPDPTGFWDGIAFNGNRGLLVGDPVDGRFTVFHTEDLGQHWTRDPSPELQADPKRDGIFAASNSSLELGATWASGAFVTGGLNGPKIFELSSSAPAKRGQPGGFFSAWFSSSLPLSGNSESAGAFSLAFNSSQTGVAVGGDYKKPLQRGGTAAYTLDGSHWLPGFGTARRLSFRCCVGTAIPMLDCGGAYRKRCVVR